MSTRIIIERDDGRYVCDKFDVAVHRDKRGAYCRINGWLPLDEMPPVSSADDGAVIARLKAENAELNRTIDDNLRVAKACRDSDQDDKFELRQERSRLFCENAKLREALRELLSSVDHYESSEDSDKFQRLDIAKMKASAALAQEVGKE